VAATPPADTATYDLVVANIVAPVLLEHAPALCSRLQRGPADRSAGGLVLSGLRDEEVHRVAGRYADLLGTAPDRSSLGGWHCLRFGARGRVDPAGQDPLPGRSGSR
jgi:ribosomal protein L11 methylase PrmA